jgi:hypothetical protein
MVPTSIETRHVNSIYHIATSVDKYSITSSEILSTNPLGSVRPHDASDWEQYYGAWRKVECNCFSACCGVVPSISWYRQAPSRVLIRVVNVEGCVASLR